MVKDSPAIPRNRRLLGMALSYRGEALEALGRPGAEEAYRECLVVVEKLTAEFPDNVFYQIDLARCLSKMAAQHGRHRSRGRGRGSLPPRPRRPGLEEARRRAR